MTETGSKLQLLLDASCLFLTFTEEYAEPAGVAIESALRNATRIKSVVIGVVDLSESSTERMREIVLRHGGTLDIRQVGRLANIFPVVGRYPRLAWTRTMATRILDPSVSRAIYLDADVIVRESIDPLLDVSMMGHGLAAVADSLIPTHRDRGSRFVTTVGSDPESPYFNTGVLVIDVDHWRESNVARRVLDLVDRRAIPIDYIDQDVLNALFANDWHQLEQTWNAHPDAQVRNPRIVQFVGHRKPWDIDARGPYVDEYKRLAASLP